MSSSMDIFAIDLILTLLYLQRHWSHMVDGMRKELAHELRTSLSARPFS